MSHNKKCRMDTGLEGVTHSGASNHGMVGNHNTPKYFAPSPWQGQASAICTKQSNVGPCTHMWGAGTCTFAVREAMLPHSRQPYWMRDAQQAVLICPDLPKTRAASVHMAGTEAY